MHGTLHFEFIWLLLNSPWLSQSPGCLGKAGVESLVQVLLWTSALGALRNLPPTFWALLTNGPNWAMKRAAGLPELPSQRARRGILMPRAKLPQGNFCRSLTAQLPSLQGLFWERNHSPLLGWRRNLGGILRDDLGEGVWESKIAARQWGVNLFCLCAACPKHYSGKRKAHTGTTPGLSQGQTQVFFFPPLGSPSLSLGQYRGQRVAEKYKC